MTAFYADYSYSQKKLSSINAQLLSPSKKEKYIEC